MKKLLFSAVFACFLLLIPKTKTEAGSFLQTSFSNDSTPPMMKDTSMKKWKKMKKDTMSVTSKMDSTKM